MSESFDAVFENKEKEPADKPDAVTEPVTQVQPRDEHGKFAPRAPSDPVAVASPEPVATPTPAPTPAPEPNKPDAGHVPIQALQDERKKRQELERRLEALETQRQQQADKAPSFQDDPEAFAQYQQQLVQQTATNTKFETSEIVAREKHGDEVVQAAMDWAMERAKSSPHFAADYISQKHPIDWAVRQQKRYALLEEIGDDPEAYKARILAAHSAAQAPVTAPSAPAAASPQPTAPKPQPKPSLASVQSAGGIQTVPAQDPFDAVFSK